MLIASGQLHYTCLAIEEGYSVDVYESEYRDPNGNLVAENATIWNQVVIPEILND